MPIDPLLIFAATLFVVAALNAAVIGYVWFVGYTTCNRKDATHRAYRRVYGGSTFNNAVKVPLACGYVQVMGSDLLDPEMQELMQR